VFKTKAEITENSERDAWLHDADETFPRGADICVNPVIIPSKRNIDPIPEIQRRLELSFPAPPIVVISELRSIGSQLRAVSGQRYQAELEIEIEIGIPLIDSLESTPPPKAMVPSSKVLLSQKS
jgi:hypothetical protein